MARQVRSVKKLDGSITSCEEERQSRWQEHFADVFQGKIVPRNAIVKASTSDSCSDSVVNTSPSIVERAFSKLKSNKGLGTDKVCAELLKIGDGATAVHYSKLYERIVENEQWPVVFAGGRLVDIYKRKGDPSVCDHSRGILLSSHASKGLANILYDEIAPLYNKHMPDCQHGAVTGKGTDFASHSIRLILDLATLAALSVFILFVDLVKAFDRAVREIVFGFPDGVTDPMEYLTSLGLDNDQAQWYAQFVAVHATFFNQWGVKHPRLSGCFEICMPALGSRTVTWTLPWSSELADAKAANLELWCSTLHTPLPCWLYGIR